MSKVTFKTTTSNNDNFQKAIASILKEMHSSTNHSLDIMQTNDDKIVIQPMGGWNYYIDFNATPKTEKENTTKIKSTVVLTDYNRDKHFLILSDEQIRILDFLIDELDYDLEYDIVNNAKEI